MLINLKVKTLDARTHEFSIDNEITIRQFKDQIAEKTNIAAENQRIIYQGRVLADDKQVKEYDVDGKVLHVAERPPFSQRGANATNNDEPMRFRNMMGGRPTPRNLRNSPYFRALDGMLVGTMAIPVNNGPLAAPGTRTPPNRFPNSSSFCINRITVALHMIDCANNIAAYLENPEVGLNNQSLDILQRGRWTMESTVVEVGVSSTDMPRNNNIIDMVQDAVTAALSRNTPGRNYTVVQLPTVYTNDGEDGAGTQQRGTGNDGENSEAAAATADGEGATGGAGSDTSEETTAAAAVIIEDVIETDDEAADAGGTEQGDDERSSSPQEAAGAAGGAGGAAAAGSADDNAVVTGIGPRRRTRPQVLANVIQRYRTVQTRLAPFVDAYYEILEQDPTFEEHETTRRENSQRIFDRVSEAFHYLSHAQHAISDLMLDLSQPGPRVLTCRPILVEQSGYIRSNNIFTPNLVASPMADLMAQATPMAARAAGTGTGGAAGATATAQATQGEQQGAVPAEQSQNPLTMQQRIDNDLRNVFGAEGAEEISAGAAEAAAAAAVVAGLVSTSDRVEDPVDEPMVAPAAATGAEQQQQQQQRPEMDPQFQMARLIQAVVNSATNDGDLHVEFNAPNIMSINLPVHVMTAAVHPPQARPATGTAAAAGNTDNADTGGAGAIGDQASAAAPAAAGAATSAGASVGSASTSTGTRSGEQRANTLPTTATQTRSTSRPQIQIGGNNNWAGRIAPTHTAFDRFLPCNSHHIREPEPLPQNNNNNNNASSSSTNNANSGQARVSRSSSGTRRAANNAPNSMALGGANYTPSATALVIGEMNRITNDAALASQGNASATPPTPQQQAAAATVALLTNAINGGNSRIPIVSRAGASAAAASVTASLREANNLRTQMRNFMHQNVFEGSPINEETTRSAIRRALNWFGDSLVYLPQYERPEYNSRDSVCNTLRSSLQLIIDLCIAPTGTGSAGADEFEERLKQICEQFRKRLYSVLFVCLGSANAELFWRQLMRLLCVPLRSNFRNEALRFLCIYVDPTIPLSMDTADAQQFLVLRSGPATAQPKDNDQQQQTPASEQLDNDVEMDVDVASSSSSSATDLEPPLPVVIVGSEPWHNNLPTDWLPAITRDLQTQSEQTRAQPPYSDAYISGMSAKRRKIIQSEKPSQNVECLIASGVQRAIQSAGLATSNASGGQPLVNPDVVIGAIAHDAAVQASYTEAVRNNARERLKQDIDYKPSKYPQIAKFTEQQK